MATYFGEVSELISRAVDDNAIDDCGDKSPKLIFEKLVSNPNDTGASLGIFAFGKVAIAFANSYLYSDGAVVIARALVGPPLVRKSLQYSGLAYPEKPREVVRFILTDGESKTLVCEVEDTFPEELSWKLYEYVREFCLSATEIAVLMVRHSTTYVTDQRSENELLIRCLATTEFRKHNSNLGCPVLEPPNVITNFPAAVLTILEPASKCAILYVCYSDISTVADENVEIFDKFLKFPIIKNVSKNVNARERFKNYLNKSNLKHCSNLFT